MYKLLIVMLGMALTACGNQDHPLETVQPSTPEEMIVGKWVLIKSTAGFIDPPYFTFSSDGMYNHVSPSYDIKGKYSINKEDYPEEYSYMNTADGQYLPYQYYLRLYGPGTYNGEEYWDDYGLIFIDDKMYLTGIHAFFGALFAKIYQKVQ